MVYLEISAPEPFAQQGSNSKKAEVTSKTASLDLPKWTPAPSSAKRKQAPGVSVPPSSAKTPSSSDSKKSKSNAVATLEIPSYQNVRSALIKGGYKLPTIKEVKAGNLYCRPCGQEFETLTELRSDLCAYGVSCQCGGITSDNAMIDTLEAPCQCWTSDDKWIIHLWVRYFVVKGSRRSAEVDKISEGLVWKYLHRLGFSKMTKSGLEVYGFPKVEKPSHGTVGVNMFSTLRDVVHHLSRFGLPESCNVNTLRPDQQMELEYHISTSHFRANTLYVCKLLCRNCQSS